MNPYSDSNSDLNSVNIQLLQSSTCTYHDLISFNYIFLVQNRGTRIEVIALDDIFDESCRSDVSEFASASEFVSTDNVALQVNTKLVLILNDF